VYNLVSLVVPPSRSHPPPLSVRAFKASAGVDKVIVLWSANTERFADVIAGVNDSADSLLAAIAAGHAEIAPSTIYAAASILEGVAFINGSPQNTIVPGEGGGIVDRFHI
jgi:myo-inositol-1-phosphate synthase